MMPPDDSSTRYKRKITDKRREQGRLAQQAYRRKQKALKHDRHRHDCEGVVANQHSLATNTDGPSCDSNGYVNNDLNASPLVTFPSLAIEENSTAIIAPRHNDCTTLSEQHSQFSTLFNGLGGLLKNISGAPNTFVSSIPSDTYIRVPRYALYAAGMENAKALGLDLLTIQSKSCGASFSPWINISPLILREDLVVPDLKPSKLQKEHAHDLYIDCLPSKDFREKLLALRAVRPVIFDEQEFILDIHYRDGMSCPGPTPWEDKSWEVETWFLRKWWMITGGESGALGLTSRWWRMLRGESD